MRRQTKTEPEIFLVTQEVKGRAGHQMEVDLGQLVLAALFFDQLSRRHEDELERHLADVRLLLRRRRPGCVALHVHARRQFDAHQGEVVLVAVGKLLPSLGVRACSGKTTLSWPTATLAVNSNETAE